MRRRDIIDVDTDPAEAFHDRLRRLIRLGVPILGVLLIAGALAGTAEDEAGLQETRHDQHASGARQVVAEPRHFRIAQEIVQRRVRIADQGDRIVRGTGSGG